jgi:cytochrome bd-type quinol oxidase subunit 2
MKMRKKSFIAGGMIVAFFVMFANKSAQAGWNANELGGFGLPGGSIGGIMGMILTWLLFALGIFGILGFLLSGSMYLLAAGDDDVIKRAKKAMTFSIVGITIGLIGYIALNVIYGILDASGNF